jgi:hypothetical protein
MWVLHLSSCPPWAQQGNWFNQVLVALLQMELPGEWVWLKLVIS